MRTPIKTVLSISLLLSLGTCQAAGFQLAGKVPGWPVGKTGVLKVVGGHPQVAAQMNLPPVATAPIQKDGSFKISLPANAGQTALHPMSQNGACKLQVNPAGLKGERFNFLIYNNSGSFVDLLELRSRPATDTQQPGKALTLIFTSHKGSVKGNCQADQITLKMNQVFQQGWNWGLYGTSGSNVTATVVTKVPSDIRFFTAFGLNGFK